MFVKKIELFGFKTFAEKTTVEMDHGITAIVGPNGSGKSNIADALLWVLGETNVRNIRGQKAVDVIFNGTEKRKALGVAEVSLTLDNACGTLPINYNEVTVTRRAYRSGEAEYFINKTRCRLKDIYELFLDTGIGREAYSFITQGEIDAVLSAKSEDRRELFEEAAGIKKYRYRRTEAMRKLEKTEANLHRVRDIMSEISGQLEPLAEQAEQAKRYNELQERLREIEIGLLIRDLRRFTENLDEVRASKDGAGEKIEALDKQLADLEWEKEKQAAMFRELEAQVDNARHLSQNLSGNVQRLEGKFALVEERLKSAGSAREQAGEDIIAVERKIEEARERIEKLELEISVSVETEFRAKAASETKTTALLDLDRRYDEISRAVNDQKANYLELAKELAAKRNALQNSKDRVAQIESGLKKYSDEIAALEAQKQDAINTGEESAGQVESLKKHVQDSAIEISRLTEERKQSEQELTDLNRKISDISRDIAARSSRLATLREMAESHEGFFEGVRTVMAAKKAGKLRGEFAVVADVISVPKGYETAIEIALGSSVQDVITDTVDEAKQAISFLKENRAGRATFLPLDSMREPRNEVRGRMDPRSGALGIAADLIGYNDKYDPAIWSLLGRTVVAGNIDDAIYLSRELDGWNKIVTLEGELIVPSGAITGGTRKNKGPELLLRKQEIDSLTFEIKNLEKSLESDQQKHKTTEIRLSGLRGSLEAEEKSLSEHRLALAEHQRRADFAAKEVERVGRQLDTVTLEKDEAQLLMKGEAEVVSRLEEELQTAGKENTDLDKQVAGAEQNIEDLAKQREIGREELMRLNVELAGATERTSALKNSLKEASAQLGELTGSLDSRRAQIDGIAVDVTSLVEDRDAIRIELDRQRQLHSAAEVSLKELLEKRTGETAKSAEIDSNFREASTKRNQIAQNTHDADVKEARLEVQIQQAADRLMEEYEVTFEQAMDWHEEIEIERGTAGEVARLRREIKDMGQVNTGAVAEYDRIKERWDFLTEQRTDLESARDQILSAITEIDTNTRGLFMETFNTVKGNFDIVFKRLFGGGKTELTLTDPNNLLETGVEIICQPPGKKLQDMALLSGGERALTATALVFSLLMSKPSPFVVMDEVDAPLDESNVEKFAAVLKDFSQNSQFIVVTHNRSTMEAADSLYGVTMQEPGISKLISVKLTAEGPMPGEYGSATNGLMTTASSKN
ncbi:MAG: chromosome segregation protein SMC [Armatimonadota bacterium]|nr:chromosome segregation protein SMC [bacterium]